MTRRIAGLFVLAMTVASVAAACPVCFGDSESQMAEGTNNGVLFLLGVVLVVQAGFVALFVSFRRRVRRLEERRARFELLEGGSS